jgi:hypothetical protein
MSINLEEKINIIHDFLYNNTLKNCYNIKTINLDQINETDYIIDDKKLSENIYNQLILNSQFKKLFINKNFVTMIRYSNNHSVLVKISIDSDNECFISYILSELVVKNKTKHILCPILNLKLNSNIIKDHPDFITLSSKSNKYIIQIKEGFEKCINLTEFINENNDIYILWQIIHTLYIIKSNYQNYRHTLSINDFIIYKYKTNCDNIEYIYDNYSKILPSLNYQVKLYNFANAYIYSEDIEEINEINERDINDLEILAKEFLKLKINSNTKKFLNKIIDIKIMNTNNLINLMNEIKIENEEVLGNQSKYTNHKYTNIRKIKKDNTNLKLNRIYDMKGGDTGAINIKTDKNNPFISNDQRETYKKKQSEQVPQREQSILLEQTIYNPPKVEPKQQLPPPTIPIYDSTNNIVGAMPYLNEANPYYAQPFQKVYNISLANPMGNYTTINRVFEDIIPGEPYTLSFTSTYERTQIINWIRNNFIEKFDGEEMDMTKGSKSLLSFIKLIDFNPYAKTKNPYDDLPKNFLLYRSAYPIRFDDSKKTIQTAKNSMGLNVRLYNLSLGEYRAEHINNKINSLDFDVWREVQYYKFIKDNVLSKKVSPNFVSMVLTKIDPKSEYGWDKINLLHYKYNYDNNNINDKHELQGNGYKLTKPNDNIKVKLYFFNFDKSNSLYNSIFNLFKINKNIEIKFMDMTNPNTLYFMSLFKVILNESSIYIQVNNNVHKYKEKLEYNTFINYLNVKIFGSGKIDITTTSNKTLVLLTEAPNNSLIKWCTPIYNKQGSRQEMIATGYHSENVYKSILFQMVFIFSVLLKYEILFNELSIDNFFIKDIYYDTTTQKYWIYNINGLDYYVPNYGYILLFDSKYRENNSNEFKIISNNTDLFSSKGNPNNINILNNIIDKFKQIFTSNTFTNNIKILGGNIPDDNTLNLINSINENIDSTNFNDIYEKYFTDYLHNKIGTQLNKSELELVDSRNPPIFDNKPKLVVYSPSYDTYIWCLYKKVDDTNPNKIKAFNKIKNTVILCDLPIYQLCKFLNSLSITPDNITDAQIIERFTL